MRGTRCPAFISSNCTRASRAATSFDPLTCVGYGTKTDMPASSPVAWSRCAYMRSTGRAVYLYVPLSHLIHVTRAVERPPLALYLQARVHTCTREHAHTRVKIRHACTGVYTWRNHRGLRCGSV
ncbi:hypothetical protein PUN28_016836 [Cardiocondyla obscurior]|uniref:Uncharacterized protein n=1 Tax=Cardiocondyla obscurior TaxID=286306 RepID=A0AAW2EP17_9HYME